jgi:molecular chaperone HscB
MGLEPRLNLDAAELQKRFYSMSRLLHPDRFNRASATEKQYSLEATAILNDAYRTLRDPVTRAEYMLAEEGFETVCTTTRPFLPNCSRKSSIEHGARKNCAAGTRAHGRNSRPRARPLSGLRREVDESLKRLYTAYDATKDASGSWKSAAC